MQLRHRRFSISMRIGLLSFTGGYWYAQTGSSTMPQSNEDQNKYRRPRVHT
jgi:hypothetical protein